MRARSIRSVAQVRRTVSTRAGSPGSNSQVLRLELTRPRKTTLFIPLHFRPSGTATGYKPRNYKGTSPGISAGVNNLRRKDR